MSLTACIRKAGKALSRDDGYYLNQVRTEYIQQGYDAKVADQMAIQSLIDSVDSELEELSAMIEEQGGQPITLLRNNVTERTPQLQEAAQGIDDGTVDKEQYADLVDEYKPVTPYETVPEPETDERAVAALTEDKQARYGAARSVEDGTPVAVRLDIPAYRDNDTWVVSIHEQKAGTSESAFQAGKSIGYDSTAVINDVTFGMPQKGALNIAKGKPKGTIATMKGSWQNMPAAEAKALADEALTSDEWTQVGMDPERHSYFYDRADHRVPIVSAEQVVQIGPLVLAKNAVRATEEQRQQILFSTSGRAKPLDRVKLDSVVGRVAPGWDANNPDSPVVVVDTFQELPPDVQRVAEANKAIREDGTSSIDGAFHNGKVYLVREEIATEKHAETVLLHEATHGGMLAAYKNDENDQYSSRVYRATNDLWVAIGGFKGFTKVAEELGIDSKINPYVEQIKGESDDYGRFVLLAEMLAYQGEKGSKGLRTKWREFVGAIRAWLRSKGFFELADMGANDIAALARKSREIGLSGVEGSNAPVLFRRDDDDTDGRDYKMDIERKKRVTGEGKLSKAEAGLIRASAPKGMAKAFIEEAKDKKAQYPESDGWAPLEVLGVVINEESGKAELKFKEQSYAFNRMPDKKRAPKDRDPDHVDDIAHELTGLIQTIYARAEAGDKNAATIIAHQSWYRGVTERLRQEFGGGADLFADLLGATSPNTPVATNYKFSVDILRRFVRGEFDPELAAFDKWVRSGKQISKFPVDDKIKQISGKLYGMNSNNGALALLNMWRDIRPGQAPKARNFALNLIGQSNMATIDVWAARMIRRAANNVMQGSYPRIPPPAEKGVTGEWNSKATDVTGEFGFGADVMRRASEMLAEQGIEVTPPDLQAIAWFAEKEHWATNDWTTVTGEGGSFEESMDANPAQRYIAGWAIQNDDTVPTAEDMSRAQERVMLAITGDKAVVAARAIPTKGLYGGYVEESFDTEWTVEEGYDPTDAMKEIATIAQEYGQWDIFVSRVVKPEEDNPNARPGVEVYFKSKQDFEMVKPQLEAFTEKGADGFTLIVDPRAQDGEYIGVRLQFIPEISARWDMDMRAEMLEEGGLERIIEEKTAILDAVVGDLIGREEVAFAQVFDYDTVVVGKENYDAIINREDAGQNTEAGREVRFGQPVRQGLEAAVRRYESQSREDESGRVQDGGDELLDTQEDVTLLSMRGPQTFEAPEVSAVDNLLINVQDKFLSLKLLQNKIVEATGKPLQRSENVYLAEQFFTGKTEQDIEKLERETLKPLLEVMSANDINLSELDHFLIARHAKERNATIAARRPDMPDGGSGMTNQQAREWMQAFDQAGKLDGLNKAAAYIDKMTAQTRALMSDSGLIDESEYYTLEYGNDWQYYVPLKGFAEDTEGNERPRTGKGFDIRGREYKAAVGRGSMPNSPTSQVVSDAMEKIIRARKNEVGQTFLELVQNNPNPDYWEVFTADGDVPQKLDIDKTTGTVQAGPIAYRNMDDVYAVKKDGVEYFILLKDQRIAEAMKNLGPQPMNWFVDGMSKTTRYLSAVNTSLNPEFVATNFTRDIQTAVYNMMAEADLEDGKIKGDDIARRAAKATGSAIKAIFKYQNSIDDKAYTPEGMEKDFAEFLEMGAKTGYFDSKDVNQIKSDIESIFEMEQGSIKGRALKAKKKIADFVERTNTAVENGVRLSAYVHARDAISTRLQREGVSREEAMKEAKVRAADLAKNLTVNFNRKGKQQWLNSIYMFFNASVQGTVNMMRAVSPIRRGEDNKFYFDTRMNRAQKLAVGMAASSFTLSAMSRAFGGEDDDGVPYWDKIPPNIRERNIVILDSLWGGEPGEYTKIPLPYGYNLFWNIGDSLEGALFTDSMERRKTILPQMVLGGMNSFSPFGYHAGDDPLDAAIMTLAPTLSVPLFELGFNRNFFGGPIYPENRGYGAQPSDAYQSFRSTKEAYKDVSRFLSEVTGGSKYKEGMIDIHPDTLEHFTEFAGGGMYRFVMRLGESGDAVLDGRDLAIRNVPFARTFRGEQEFYQDQTLFYDRADSIKQSIAAIKESETPEERAEMVSRYGREAGLKLLMEKGEKDMRVLRRRRDAIEAREGLTDAERDEKLKEVEQSMKTVIDRFNKRYNEVMTDGASS